MKVTIELTEAEIGDAVEMYLRSRGMRTIGAPTIQHHEATDPRERSYPSITVEAEPIPR
jgi:hypothetical protein